LLLIKNNYVLCTITFHSAAHITQKLDVLEILRNTDLVKSFRSHVSIHERNICLQFV